MDTPSRQTLRALGKALAVALLTIAVVVPALALPAQGGERSKGRVEVLRKQVAALSLKVRRLEERTRSLEQRVRGLNVSLGKAQQDKELLRGAVARSSSCPVTFPNGQAPPGAGPSATWHGGPELWVAFWPRGVVVRGDGVVQRDGSLVTKLGRWRGAPAQALTIAGRQLDGDSKLAETRSAEPYGERGLLPSMIRFPSGGCWEITGTAGTASLTFIVLVLLD